jgi:hypothetical protein
LVRIFAGGLITAQALRPINAPATSYQQIAA